MGGKVFDRPAARLDNAQFSRLETYCHRILRPFFQDILTNRHLGEKETHGDIDLLCAWDGVDVGTYIRGQDRGRVLEEADGAATQPTGEEDQGASVKRLFEGTQFTAWIECIARNFKAEEWTRLGTEVHILALNSRSLLGTRSGGTMRRGMDRHRLLHIRITWVCDGKRRRAASIQIP
jgi:hypothetical protein